MRSWIYGCVVLAFCCAACPGVGLAELKVPLKASVKAPAKPPAKAPQKAHGSDVLIQVVAREHAAVAAGMDGRIERLMVREGDRFRKGALLVAFECAGEQGLLDRASAASSLADTNADIQARLYKMGSSSEMELATARAEGLKAAAEKRIASASVRRCRISAPFSGGVSELMVQQYQTVKKGDLLMRIVNTGNLEIQMFVPSKWLRWLKPGYRFRVSIDELGREYDAEVRATGTWIDAVSQSVAVFARFSVPAPELLPGMSGHAIIELPK